MALTRVSTNVIDVSALSVSIASDTTVGGVKQYVDKFNFYDVVSSVIGKPGNGTIITQFMSPRAISMPIGAGASLAKSSVAAAAIATFTLKKNGTNFGTITFAAGGMVGTFTVATATSFAAGDVLVVVAPATADATLADINIALTFTLV